MLISRRKLLAASPLLVFPLRGLRGNESAGFEELTPQSQQAVERGTAWLLKTFNSDGGCGTDIGHGSDIGCSAMVGMALLSQGYTVVEGEQNKRVERLVQYLLRCAASMPPGDITSQVQTQLQNKIGRHAHTFFATLMLSQVIGEGWDDRPVRRALTKLVDAISGSQTSDGHWGQQSWAPTLGTVMGWVALRGAHGAGFRVEASANKTADHLVRQMQQQLAENQHSWMHQLYKNATGIRVLYAMGLDNEPVAKRAFEDVLTLINTGNTPFTQAGGEEYLSFHLITETMLQKQGRDWARWYPTVRDKLIGVQNRDGSWTGHHCITSRTFCTAASVLVLSAPNRFLPISAQ